MSDLEDSENEDNCNNDDSPDDESCADPEQILRDEKEKAKKDFEEERDRILNSIPESYKSMFGQIGFVTWGKVPYPVLIVNPYNTPPGHIRNQWISMFKKLQKQGQLERMTYLIYWYGASRPSEYYSFQPRSKFTPYEVEAKKPDGGISKLPSKIQEKVDKGIALSAKEDEELQRYAQMEEDLKKNPIDRRRGDIVFQEGYESLTLEDAIQAMGGESSSRKRKKPGRPSNRSKKDSKQRDNKDEQRQTEKKRRDRLLRKQQEQELTLKAKGDLVLTDQEKKNFLSSS